MLKKCFMFFLLLTVYQISMANNLKQIISLRDEDKINLFSMRKQQIKKKFGEDMYKTFRNKEKMIKNTLNNIIIPNGLRENLDIDFDLIKEIKITCTYTYRF